jgi:hypothetical protein
MGAATEFRSPHRRDAPAYLSTVEDLITYLRAGDGLRLGAAITFEFGPDTSKRERRAIIIIEREPDDILLFGLGVRLRRILGKNCWRGRGTGFRA